MPIIKSAKKKVRQDKRRKKINIRYLLLMNKAISIVKKAKDKKGIKELISQAYTAIDRAAAKKIIHKNKAARLKSAVSRYAISAR